jgi:hypothetical protein
MRSPDCRLTATLGTYLKFRSLLLTRYYSCEQIKKNDVGSASSTYGGRRFEYRVLVDKPKGKRPIGKTLSKREDNIKKGLQEMVWGHELD